MPPAAQYPGPERINGPEAQELDRDMDKELSARRRRIDENIKRYHNEVEPPLTSTEYQKSNVTLPLCRLIIDKGVGVMTGTDDFGNVEGTEFVVTKDEAQQRSGIRRALESAVNLIPGVQIQQPVDPRQDFLDRFWDANRKNKFLHNFFLGNGLAGHYFLQIEPNALPDPRGSTEMLPRIIALDARNVVVFWHEMDAEKVLWYSIVVGEKGRRRRKDVVRLYKEDGTEAGRWAIYNYKETSGMMENGQQQNKWAMDGTPVEWVYRWAPIMDGQNLPSPVSLSYYGEDDLGTLGVVNDALNYSVSINQMIQRHHGFPRLVVTGGGLEDGFKNKPNQAIQLEEPGAKVYYVHPTSDGKITMDQMQYMERQFWNSAREVDPAAVAGQLGKMSNFDLRVVYQDALFKRQSKWLDAAETLRDMCQAALELGGFGAHIPVKVTPPAPLPTNLAETASALDVLSNHGLSDDTILTRVGFEPDDERAKRKLQEREGAARATRGNQAQSADESAQVGRAARVPSSNPLVEAQRGR